MHVTRRELASFFTNVLYARGTAFLIFVLVSGALAILSTGAAILFLAVHAGIGPQGRYKDEKSEKE